MEYAYHSRATQSVLLETSSMELSVVQNSRSVALRPLQLFWSRRIIAYKDNVMVGCGSGREEMNVPAELQSSVDHVQIHRHSPPKLQTAAEDLEV